MTGSVWLTSDTHFRHPRVAELRGFTGPNDHDVEIVDRWNTTVRPGDQVWHLGDVGMGPPALFLPLVQQLHGEIHLVAGNHDQVWPGHRHAYRHQDEWRRYFASIQPWTRRRLAGHDIMLCHLPYDGDHTIGNRYAEYRLPDRGMPLLCGHVHGAWDVLHTTAGTLQINVGVDVWDLRPVSLDVLAGMVRDQPPRAVEDGVAATQPLHEWPCPSCGAVTRARMADHDPTL